MHLSDPESKTKSGEPHLYMDMGQREYMFTEIWTCVAGSLGNEMKKEYHDLSIAIGFENGTRGTVLPHQRRIRSQRHAVMPNSFLSRIQQRGC